MASRTRGCLPLGLSLGALAALTNVDNLPAQGIAAPSALPSPALRNAQPRRAPDGRLQIVAAEARAPITVDGVLDEEVWARAEPVSGFVQAEPHEGAPASERTEVRVAFDGEYLYVGATMHDREPGGAVVNDIRKDFREDTQDSFELLLDTFGDRRNGYVFITNPEGARADRQIANEGREINTSWDAMWSVGTRRTADGWTAEMAIPFRALRFGAATQTWGINFSRRIRRRNEVDFWSPVPRAYNLARVSLAGDLAGLTTATAGRDLRVKPYVAARTIRETGGPSFDEQADIGADAKIGLTRSLTLDVTVNPDFAQAEADEQQVNLTQFSQFFPEKREFFLENSGIFYVGDAGRNNRISLVPTPDEDLLLFFSRRIGLAPDGRTIPIAAGVRLTGQVSGFTVGALSMQSRADGSRPAENHSVIRLRRNVLRGSDIGIVAMNRQATDGSGDYNRVFGADANVRFAGRIDWNSYLIGTRTPGIEDGQYAARTSLNFDGNFFHAKGGVMEVGDGFRDDLGYYRRTAVRKYFDDIGIRPRLASLRRIGIREMHPHTVWNYYEDLDGSMLAKRLHTGYTFFLDNGGFVELSYNPAFERIATPFRINQSIEPLAAGSYSWHDWTLRAQTDQSRRVAFAFTGTRGGLWNGTQRTVDVSATVRSSYRARLTTGVQRTSATVFVPDAADFVATVWKARGSVSFSTNMFLDALAQYDPERDQVNANVRFNLIHHPLSDLFVVYNEQRFTTPDAPVAGRSVIVKFTQMVAF